MRFLFILLFCLPSISIADSTTEIAYLLDMIKQTDCRYQRNGKFYQGTEALEHIEKKRAYFQDEIHSAEDFIRLSASKSSLSGKAYLIHCPNKAAEPSQTWLLRALADYRQLKPSQLSK